MKKLFFALIAIPFLTTGRRLFALNQSLEVARRLAASVIMPLIEAAIEHDLETLAMARAWLRAKEVKSARGKAVDLDNQIDKLLGNILARLKGNVESLDPADKAVGRYRQLELPLLDEL
jgi:hypothetical protein